MRPIDPKAFNTVVEVYRNLQQKCWSIRDPKTKRIVGHAHSLTLENCTFHVSKKGNERVRREKKKYVHAYIKGTLCLTWTEPTCFPTLPPEMMGVKYNPYENVTFVVGWDSKTPVYTAKTVAFENNKVWCK